MRFLTQLFLTALFYGSVPMLVVLISRKIQAKAFKRICIVWCIVLALIFIALNSYYETGNTTSYMPAIIWGWVFHKIGCAIIDKRICASQLNAKPIRKTKAKTKESKSAPNSSANTLETWYTCPNCGCLVRAGENCDCGFQYKTRTVNEFARTTVNDTIIRNFSKSFVNSLHSAAKEFPNDEKFPTPDCCYTELGIGMIFLADMALFIRNRNDLRQSVGDILFSNLNLSSAPSKYISLYFDDMDIIKLHNDRMDTYGGIVRGTIFPHASWWLGSLSGKDEDILFKFALQLGDFLFYPFVYNRGILNASSQELPTPAYDVFDTIQFAEDFLNIIYPVCINFYKTALDILDDNSTS